MTKKNKAKVFIFAFIISFETAQSSKGVTKTGTNQIYTFVFSFHLLVGDREKVCINRL